jgi:hypothetical protein
MESESLEIECPVCDRKIPADAKECPSCGIDLSTAGMDELEEVARDISEGKPESAPEVENVVPRSNPAPQVSGEVAAIEPKAEEKHEEPAPETDNEMKEKGGLRRLFGRKKH